MSDAETRSPRPPPSIGKAEVTMLAGGGCRRLARLNMENFSQDGSNLAFGSTPALRAQGADGQRSERQRADQLRALLNRGAERHHAAQTASGKRTVMALRDVIRQARSSGHAVNFFSEVSFTPTAALNLGVPVTVRAHEPDLIVTYQNEGRYRAMMKSSGQAPQLSYEVCPDGSLRAIEASDPRLQLRVIDLKASAETSRKQLLEAAWYALAMSAWLASETGESGTLNQSALVRADFGIWNGHAQTDPIPSDDLDILAALTWIHDRFTTGDSEQLLARLMATVDELPEVTTQPYTAQPWSLKPECEGCGFLQLSPPVGDAPARPGGCAGEARGTTRALPAYDALLEHPAAQNLLELPLARANLTSRALKDAIGTDQARALGTQQLAQTSGRTQVMAGMNHTLNLPAGQDVSLSLWLERDSATGLIGGAGLQVTHLVRAPGDRPETIRWARAAPERSAAGEAELLRDLLMEMQTQITSVPARRERWPTEPRPADESAAPERTRRKKKQPETDQGTFQVFLWNGAQAEAWRAGMGRLLSALGSQRPDWARLIWLQAPAEAAPWPRWSGGRGLSVVSSELNRVLALPGSSQTLQAYSDLTRTPADRAAALQARAQRRAADGQRGRDLQVEQDILPLSEERGFHLLMRHWNPATTSEQERSTYHLTIHLHVQARLLSRVMTELQVPGRQFGLKLSLAGPRGQVSDLQPRPDAELGPTHQLWINQHELDEMRSRDEAHLRQMRGLALMQESGHAVTLRDLKFALAPDGKSVTARGLTTDRGTRIVPGGFNLALYWIPAHATSPLSRRTEFVTQTRANEAEDHVTLNLQLTAEEAKAPQKTLAMLGAARQWWIAAGTQFSGASKLQGALGQLGPQGGDPHDVTWRLRDAATRQPRGSHPGLDLLHPGGDQPQRSEAHLRAAQAIPHIAPSLTPAQRQAAQTLLSRRAGLLWGPPGTGKSQVLAAVITSALQQGLRVLITATNYAACDTLLTRALKDSARTGVHAPYVARLVSPGRTVSSDPNLAALTLDRNDLRYAELRVHLATGGSALISAPHQEAYTFINRTEERPAFDLIVVDEGSQLPASGLSLPLTGAAPGCTLIVAGDPLQLPAIQSPPPEGLEALCGSAYAHLAATLSQQALDLNWRSDALIVDASRPAGYDHALQAATPVRRLTLRDAEHHDILDWIVAPERPCVLIEHHEGGHRSSPREAELTGQIVARLYDRLGQPDPEQFWGHDVGIVTPHRAQVWQVAQRLIAAFPTHPADLIAASVGTADTYQGQERGTIIVSPGAGTRAGIASEEAFIYAPERWNVAFSRAQSKLIVLMTPALLRGLPEDEAAQRGLRLLQRFAARATETGPAWPEPPRRGLRPPGPPTPPPRVSAWPPPDTATLPGS